MTRIFRPICLSSLLLFVLPAALRAQVAGRSVDAAFTFGYSYVNGFLSNTHFVYGGSGAYNFNSYIAAGFEYTYTPLGSETLSVVTDSGNQKTYGGFGRLSLAHARVTPYLVGGFGGVNEKEVFATNIIIGTASQSGHYYAFGAGASIFPGHHWGVRPELRYEQQQFDANAPLNLNAYSQRDLQLNLQLFYQAGGK